MSLRKSTPHALAAQVCAAHAGWYFLTTLEQLIIRCVTLAPLMVALTRGQFFGLPRNLSLGASLLCSLLLFLLLVLPERYRLGEKLCGWFDAPVRHGGYGARLRKGLLRFLKVCPLLLPAFVAIFAVYYVFTFLGFPDFFKMLEAPGKLLTSLLSKEGQDLSLILGLAVWAVGLLTLIWLAARGWRRQMSPSFYLSSDQYPPKASVALSRARRLNFLLILPAALAVLALLWLSLSPRLSGSAMFDTLTVVTALTQFDFPASTQLYCALVLLIAYLPFVLWRKAALAAAHHARP